MQSRLIQQLDATLLPRNTSRQSAIFSYVLFKLAVINTNIDTALSYFNDDAYNKKQLLALILTSNIISAEAIVDKSLVGKRNHFAIVSGQLWQNGKQS